MQKILLISVIFILLISKMLMAQTTFIKNVNGYTFLNQSLQQFTAISFTDETINKIYLVGDVINPPQGAIIIDGLGQTMLPGLIDAHGHVLSYGHSLLRADLINTSSEVDAVNRTIAYAKRNPTLGWILGRGWNQVQWSSNTFPNAKLLDDAFPNQAVWLNRVDGHAGWANSKAMALAGITSATIAPAGGEIIKDINGQPTGVFIDNAMDLITASITKP